MFSRKPAVSLEVPQLVPLPTEKVKLYLWHILGRGAVRLQLVMEGLVVNREALLATARTTEEILDGLFQGCPYIDHETALRDIRGFLTQMWGWCPDTEERWFPRT